MCKSKICFLKSPVNLKNDYNPINQQLITNRSVIYKGKTWDVGSTLNIAFINGSAEEILVVKRVYDELNFLNLNFKFTQDLQDSDIRWTFTKGQGSWSYLGTDATFTPKHRATINIGWDINYSVVRHEIGHSLGLAHEHQNPSKGILWNKPRVIKDLTGPPNNWTIAQIENNVFKALNKELVDYTDFDPNSIMLYGFPKEWTLNNQGTNFNSNWSEKDKQTLKKYYPLGEIPEEPVDKTLIVLKNVFPSVKKLDRLNENQLLSICDYLMITATKDDLKKDTIQKIAHILFK